MVLNLLQRFSLEEAKELVLKSFGYFSSNSRIEPLLLLKEFNQEKINECNSFMLLQNVQQKIYWNTIKLGT